MSEFKSPHLKFKAYLIENEIKQGELAEAMGISDVQLSQKIHRKGNKFNIDEVAFICNYLKISADDFFLEKPFQKREIVLA